MTLIIYVVDFGDLTSGGGGGGGDGGPTIVPMAANASDLDPFSSLTLDSLQAILHVYEVFLCVPLVRLLFILRMSTN